MIAPRFLPREEWEVQLLHYKCRPLQGKGKLNTAEWWRTKWDYLFIVPVENDGTCHQQDFQRVIAGIMKSAPPGTLF